MKGYGGWISIKNLPLDYWSIDVYKAIGGYFGGFESISLKTMNLINCSEAKIKVSQNLCGFLPAMVELRDAFRDNIFLNFGDIKVLEAPKVIEEALFISYVNNPIDLLRINQVLLDEGGESPDMLKLKWAFLSSKYSNQDFRGTLLKS